MERTLISFNLPNMLTVGLMAFGLYAILMLGSQFLKNRGVTLGGGGGY